LPTAIAALALAGVAIAGYLTWVHYAGTPPVCLGGSTGCERVQSSEYAQLFGVPVALLGVAGYVAVLGSLALRGEFGRTATAFLALVGTAFSGYLTYVELVELHAVCQWCVASALLMLALAAVSTVRLLRG
jgi:uncharacterized membrane protein